MAKFLPLRDVYSGSEDEDEDDVITDDVDGPGDAFQKYYNNFIERFGSRKRKKAKRKKAEEQKEKEKQNKDEKDSKPPVDEHEYDFNNTKRGMAIIINNDKFNIDSNLGDRKGSKYDANGLETMFKQLGFDVTLHNNLTTKTMVSVLKQAASNKSYDHEDADCFACAILSHGGEEVFQPRDDSSNSKVRHDVVFGVDGVLVPTRFLLSIFNDECCPELEGKPRLFFIQACRGKKMDEGMGIKVLTRKKKTTQNTTSGGQDQQDAQMYLSESEDDGEGKEDRSHPGNELQAEKEIESPVPETKGSDVSKQSHEEQIIQDDVKGEPQNSMNAAVKDEASAVEEQKEEHPIQKSSVQESQGPSAEAKKQHPVHESSVQESQGPTEEEEKSGTEDQEQSKETISEEPEVIYSRIAMEKILTISPPPLYKDFLLMYAAPPGYFAWRRDTGGWLIQTLINVLRTADVNTIPLGRLLTTVSGRVSKDYQSASRKRHMTNKKLIPCVMSMLTKDVYFRSKHS